MRALLLLGLAPASSSLLRRWWAGGNATAHRLFTPSPRAEENLLASYYDPRAVAWCERKYRELPGVVTGCGFRAIKRDWLHKYDCGHVVRHLAEADAVSAPDIVAAARVYAGNCPFFIDDRPWPEPGRFVYFGEASKRRRAAVTPPAAWRPWVCDGTVAIDVGAAWGDTATSMALAAGPRGAVFALELIPALHHHNVVNALANRNLSRLIPVNVAVRGPGAGKLPKTVRAVRVWRWFSQALPHLRKHVSFVKIDVDALSALTAVELLEDLEAADERPVIKAEWFGGDRKRGCTRETEKVWEAARTAGYGVFAADATTSLESCAAALARARAHDGGAFPGGGGSLYADLYLLPGGISAVARRCPPVLPKSAAVPALPIGRGDVLPGGRGRRRRRRRGR
ncbi:unnamed protein product [Pelagomonas calceolata]|jgi:hypothetical protein|uniref:Methyltransferase FkbM domain-containing protein n=1 Tax=Pelagomonas calceolata TaxID=35677 RepID=A0A8J2X303_9STRA|nr:unnamed protein product [Pelagomonas calceolata]